MSKGNHYKVEQLKKEFNKAMKLGNIELARKIDAEINSILGY